MATSWSYVPDDVYKPANKIIHLLVDIVAKGGNFLLNIGPSPSGEFSDTAYARLREIGDWMKINGEAIYKTRPVDPYKSGKVCFTSLPDGKIFAIYLAEPGEKMPAEIHVEGFQPVHHINHPGCWCKGKSEVEAGRKTDSSFLFRQTSEKTHPVNMPGHSGLTWITAIDFEPEQL